ncbi:MAG: hypothetical protein Q9174_003342, partial [Haloplaca sp. 1 TL-2023]
DVIPEPDLAEIQVVHQLSPRNLLFSASLFPLPFFLFFLLDILSPSHFHYQGTLVISLYARPSLSCLRFPSSQAGKGLTAHTEHLATLSVEDSSMMFGAHGPPPPPPPHPPQPGMPPGIQVLPAEFDRLNIGTPAAQHIAGHQQARHPPLDRLDHRGHDFDTTLLRKEKDLYEGYTFERVIPQQPNEKASWSVVNKERLPVSQGELVAMVNKQKRKGPLAYKLLMSDDMKGFKRKQVSQLIDDRRRSDPRFDYELAGLKLEQYKDRRGRGTSTFQVILKRQLRKDLPTAGLTGFAKLHEPAREIVDLTRLPDEPSEGSSQGFHRGSPPLPHFGSPPRDVFMDQNPFDHPPHQMPFMNPPQQPMPAMHPPHQPMPGMHHEMHGPPSPHHGLHGPPSPPQVMHMEEPFIQVPPPPPFAPQVPHHPHQGPPMGMPKEPKEASHRKEPRHEKPMIHQDKPHKTPGHRKLPSESDWDFVTDSSDSSRGYGERTPETSRSGSSARKNKDYRGGKDSRRSSRSHRDDRDRDGHGNVYRMHRRKPTVSPERPRRNSGRPQYDAEDVEILPASNSRSHRPYLHRSRTSAHRVEHAPEYLDRPTFHSRHMSYDEDRRRDFRGLTPPGRRTSVLAPKRPLALDIFDARESQDRLAREEIRRELIREQRREAELRESVARELDREEEMRRRERMLGRDILSEERPGRYSRGYDNDRYLY